MAVYNDLQLKQWFETGDFPTQQQFFDLIDSKVNVLDLPTLLGLEVGVTNVTGGVDRGIMFQQGTKFSEQGQFLYDYTNKRIGMDIANPLTRFHAFSSTGNVDAAPLVFTFQRVAGVINTNTTWFAFNAMNGAGQGVGGFNCGQQAVGQGTRLSFSTTTNSGAVAATESMRISQEKRVSIGNIIGNGARIDVHSEGNLSTDLVLRLRNNANTLDLTTIAGDGSLQHNGSVAFSAKQTHVAGAAVVMAGNVHNLIVNPAVLLPALVVTLPATAGIKDGHVANIVFGGAIGGGGTVVGAAGFNVVPNGGQVLIGNYPRGGITTKQAGDSETYIWNALTATWYSFARQ